MSLKGQELWTHCPESRFSDFGQWVGLCFPLIMNDWTLEISLWLLNRWQQWTHNKDIRPWGVSDEGLWVRFPSRPGCRLPPWSRAPGFTLVTVTSCTAPPLRLTPPHLSSPPELYRRCRWMHRSTAPLQSPFPSYLRWFVFMNYICCGKTRERMWR